MTGFLVLAWFLGLAGAGVVAGLASAENWRVVRAGRVAFAGVLAFDLLLAAVGFAVEADSTLRSFWWLMAIACGVPLAFLTGFGVRRAYAGHRLTLASAVLTTAALYLAFPLGYVHGGTSLSSLGRFEHTHHALDVVILAIPTLILLLSEVLRWREAPDPEEPSLFSHIRNAPRRAVVGVVLVAAAVLWLAGATDTAAAISLGVLLVVFLVGGGLYLWWIDRKAVRRIRRDLQ